MLLLVHNIDNGLIVDGLQEFKPSYPVPALDFQYIVPERRFHFSISSSPPSPNDED